VTFEIGNDMTATAWDTKDWLGRCLVSHKELSLRFSLSLGNSVCNVGLSPSDQREATKASDKYFLSNTPTEYIY